METFIKFIKWKEANKVKSTFANKVEFNNGIMTRISSPILKDAINYKNERKVLKIIKKQNITSKTIKYYISKKKVYLKRHFIEGSDFVENRFYFEDHFRFVNNEITKLHANTSKKIIKFDILKTISYYRDNNIDMSKISNILKFLESNKLVLTHGDCWPNNIILGYNKVWLIDFEYACLNDFLFDYSILSIGFGISVEKLVDFLSLDKEEEVRLREWVYFNRQIYIEWIKKNYDLNLNVVKEAINFLKD